ARARPALRQSCAVGISRARAQRVRALLAARAPLRAGERARAPVQEGSMSGAGAIVMGASLGGMQSVQSILQALAVDFALPMVVALHRPRDDEDLLTPLLQRGCALRVSEVVDKEPIEARRVYVAPPDYHVLIEDDCLSLSVDERVNHARPSIDVL